MKPSASLKALFSNAESTYAAFPIKQRIKSTIFIFFFVLTVSLSGMFAYNYGCNMKKVLNIVVHRDRPETDFCYQDARLGEVMYGETVVAPALRGSLVEEKIREKMEAEGKPLCYCRRYLVHDQEAGKVYNARASYLGAEAGSVDINVFSMKRSRLLKILASQGKNVLMKPEDVPLEYLLPPEILVYNKTQQFIEKESILKVTPKKLNMTELEEELIHSSAHRRIQSQKRAKSLIKFHHNYSSSVEPADCAVVVYTLKEDFKQRFLTVQGGLVYDYIDVPNFTNEREVGFFNWSSTLKPVTWGEILYSDAKGFSSDLYTGFTNIKEMSDPLFTAGDEWYLHQEYLHINATEELDPFLSGVEICSSYSPRDMDMERYAVREYNFVISYAPLAFPDYSWGICLVGSIMAALGQFFLLPPFEFLS